jgi:putative glutamine amidotransferase
MTSKYLPTIGVVCPSTDASQAADSPHYTQKQAYVAALVRAGAAPLLLPQLADSPPLRAIYARLDGLLLPGGGDVDPVHYGESIHEKCGSIDTERDGMELALTRWAIEDGKPLFAICRGIQVLNVALGGSLYQDIQAQVPGALEHTRAPGAPPSHLAHAVAVIEDTQLAEILGADPLQVNSRHHQAIKNLAPGLAVAAEATDGIIEAVEVTGQPYAIGVQWHPEDLAGNDAQAQRLFDAFRQSCR